jgi:phosphate-selective porin OprO/OprP
MERIMKLKKFAALGSAALIATAAAWTAQADMTVNVGGRIQVDAAVYDDDDTDLGDGTEFRRARFFVDGNIDDSWKYKLQIDFADNDLDMKDAYIQHSSGFKIGQFKAPFSLDALTSSKYGTFMERAMVVDTFAPGRKIGIGWGTRGDVWTFDVMGHGQNAADQEAPADEGWGAAGRITWAPINDDDMVLHFGGALSWEQATNGDSEDFRYRARPESHVTNQRLIDTGTIEGLDYQTRAGLEAAWVWNSLSLQGEYIFNTVECDDACFDDGNALRDDSYDLSGWYAYVSWLTGGNKRVYKDGQFGRTKAKNAWEFAARYSVLDLNDGNGTLDPNTGLVDGLNGGEETNITLGVNYYVNPYLRFMFNYVYVDDISDGPKDGENPSVFQVRAAMDFK